METTHNPPRAGHLAYVLSICLLGFSSLVFSQPTITVRFANPVFDCMSDEYCVDVEFLSSVQDVEVFGMNVRFFYDDDVLELVGFSDYQGGYGPFAPDPPEIFTNGPAGPALFNFEGPAEFVNGSIQLLDSTGAIALDTVLWTKLFQICFIVEDTNPDVDNFCPSLVWDLEQDPANGGFNTGDDGVVITIVDPDPFIESAPTFENVVQFNWIYIGPGTPPYGMPVETECTSINCNGRLSVLKTDTLLIGDCLEPGDSILYDITVINEGMVTISNITISDPGTIGLECIPAVPFTLDPGDTVICTAVHILTQGNINAGSYSNVATASGINPDTVMVSDNSDDPADTTDIDPNMDGNPDDPTVTPLPFSELSVTKTDIIDFGANGTLEPGDEILYSITVTNTGNQLISNITLSDPNASGLSCFPATPFSLAPGASASCSASHVVTQADIDAGFYENSATATGQNPAGDPVTDVSDDPDDLTDIDPDGDCNPDDPTITLLEPTPILIVRFTNPDFNCLTEEYCLDVEIMSDTDSLELFGMNVRFFYDDDILELIDFRDYQGGYGPVSPDPPIVSTSAFAGPAFFNFAGPADFVNGAIQLTDDTQPPIYLSTTGWTKIFQVCFMVDDPDANLDTFCPPIVWDLEVNPEDGGFLIGDDGVVLTIVDPDSIQMSVPVTENVVQFNWQYSGPGTPPYGEPIELECTSINCFPMLTCAADITIECDESTDPSVTGFATSSDNCEGDSTITFSDTLIVGSCPQSFTITRTWIVINACDLSDTCIQMITVIDTTAPIITCPPDTIIECSSTTLPDGTGFATATDNCDTLPDITFIDSISLGGCPQEYTIMRTWIANDTCGNADSCLQIIQVIDTLPPLIICPPDTIIECTASTLPASTGFAAATDNCDTLPEVTYSDVSAGGSCPLEYTITRTWIATDTCGNTSSCTQIISIIDTIPPAITCPGDITIECDVSTSPDVTGIVSATDNCDTLPLIVSSDVTIAGSCPQDYTIQRTWTVTDACGNSSTCVQVIGVEDSTPPVIACPVDLILACTDTIPSDTASAIDNCSGVIAYSFSDIVCENPVMGFTDIYDFTNWTIILPPEGGSVTAMGDSEVMLVSPDDVTVCDDASVLFQMVIPSTGQLVFDWNYLTNDSDGPAFDPFGYRLNSTFFQLTNDNGPDAQSGTTTIAVTAGDVFAFEQQSTDCIFGAGATTVVEFFACIEQIADVCTELIIRTHTATDECGNESSCVQTLFVVDTIAPVITCPLDITIECDESTSPVSTGFATATENCTSLALTFADIILPGSCPQESTINRTWMATDACGNSSTCLQVIVVDDSTPPVITCPADVTIECTDSSVPDSTGIATATDNCDPLPAITYADVTAAGSCPQAYMISRTWVATDTCGNSSSCIQIIQIIDTLPPAISCPPNLTLECTASTSPDSTGFATATDNCDTLPAITFADVIITGTCAQESTINRTWTATDACGNSSTCLQTIFTIDTIAPAIVCPPDVVIGSTESTSPDSTGIPTVDDNCDSAPTITSSDVTIEDPCLNSYFIHRTWIASDGCGNSATCLQVIHVNDSCIVDLALEKSLNAGQDNLEPGDDVVFTIEVTNEGNIPMGEIHVVDYIPIGFALNDADWTAGTDGSTGQSASIVLSVLNGYLPAGGLQAGQSVSVEITLHIDDNILPGAYENIAEISVEIDINGNDVSTVEVDSDPDTDDTNDPESEDDHDGAIVCLLEPPVIIGDLFVCPGDFVTYTVGDFNPNLTYVFSLPNGGGSIVITTPSSITVHWGNQTGGPFEISLTVIASPECQDSTSIFVSIEGGDAIACIDHINLSIDNECGTVVLSGMILTGEGAGNNTFQVFIIDMNGDTVPNATLTFEHVGQTFKVSVVSVCTGQSCWGFLTVEDKLPPVINCVCPLNNESDTCEINCLQLDEFLNEEIPEDLRPTVLDNCGGTTLEVINVEYSFPSCINGFLRVTWKATDTGGNTSTCIQEFDIVPFSLDSLVFPSDYEGECGTSADPSVTGWPQIDGMDLIAGLPICNIMVTYFDRELPLCGGGRRILRTWNVMDWCAGETQQFLQMIKLGDHIGPVLTCPANMIVNTDVWFCYANVIVPKPLAVDACSEIESFSLSSSAGNVVTNGNLFSIHALPVGTHTITWTVRDECHNSSTCTFQITVEDHVPPTVSCHLHTVVSLSNERSNGITLVNAESFNDGSFDNCGNVTFRARRMDSCIDQNWTTNGACIDDTPGGNPPIDGFDLGTILAPCVPFACCDIGQQGIMVELEVTDEAGNVNYCMVEVEVQDKLAPELICPPQIMLSCEFLLDIQEGLFRDIDGNNDGTLDEDPLSEIFGNMYDAFRHDPSERQHIIINDPDNPNVTHPFDWGIEGWATDNCQLELSVLVNVIEDCSGNAFPGDAPAGAVKLIERRFFGNDGVQAGSCLQRIWVIDFNPYFIEDTTCFNENPSDGVIWPCDVLLTNCPDDPMGTGVPIIVNDGCSLIGVSFDDARYDFVDNVCYKILRTWKVLDWCQFDPNTGYGLWTYTQTIKIADAEGAEFLDAPSTPPEYCVDDPGISIPDNNQMFLGENNPDASSCSVHTNLSLHVHETCSPSILYDVKIYLFNGPDYIQIVPETLVNLDANHEAEIHFNTEESTIPSIQENGLPYNSPECGDYHRVLWSVEDGCGNRSFADYLFRLEDCKNPTPVCIDGISTVVMPPEGEVTIFASSFNASSFDDCTPGDELLFSFSGDTYQPSFTYTCDNVPDFGVEIPVQIWAADAGVDQNCNEQIEWSERNKDFCITTIVITDNNDACDDGNGLLEGEILTAYTNAVGHVTVNLMSPENTFPPSVTGQDGKFSFANVPLGSDYTIVPARNDNYRNGVSTLDLVGIQRHLLGLEVFNSPYQYIAADANNSKSVSAIDLIEIRKLILGIQDEFTSNQSWRFVRKGIPMSPGNPWPFEEDIDINQLDSSDLGSGLDFVGVKIGDINNTVQANATQILPRSPKRAVTVKATYDGSLKPGEIIDVEFEFSEQVSGFQWTFETSGLEFAGITSDDIEISEQNIGMPESGVITMSWNGDVAENGNGNSGLRMTMRFKVTKEGKIINMIHLGSKITAAEAYTLSGEIMNVNLTFNSSGVFTDFALFQNKPNPWNHETVIGFHLPSNAAATLTIYDLNGKILKTISGDYKAGYNSVTLSVKDIQATGILYYRLDSGPYSANKKMVIIQ